MPVFTDGSLSLVQIWPGSGSDLADLRREIIEFDACQGSSLTRQLHGLFSNHLFIFQKKKKREINGFSYNNNRKSMVKWAFLHRPY